MNSGCQRKKKIGHSSSQTFFSVCISFSQEKWVEVAPMAVARAGVSVSAVNGLLYAVGGRASSRDFSAPVTVDSVEIYDPHLDTWTEIGNMITSRCDGGVAVL